MASSVRLIPEAARRYGLVLENGRKILPLCVHGPAALPLTQTVRGAASKPKKSKGPSKFKKKTKGLMPIATAVEMVKSAAKAKFTESVDLAIVLNVDTRKSNEIVRGVVQLPKGSGKKVRVAVFAKGDDVQKALAAGADIVGADDLLQSVLEGNIDFDKCVATPEMMPIVGRAGRVLGPRGLMPNAKTGSVTRDVEAAVQAAKAGQANIRAGKNGVLHLGVGKVDFEIPDLLENVRASMVAISNLKPEVIKGEYIQQVHVSSTMGKAVNVDVPTVDPSHARFMLLDPSDASTILEGLPGASTAADGPSSQTPPSRVDDDASSDMSSAATETTEGAKAR